jgi:hypothetical protein
MQSYAYLLPPKQRVITQFMNLNDSIDWATKMLLNLDKIPVTQRMHFMWLKAYATFIAEIRTVFCLVNQLIKLLKQQRLSYLSVENT